MRRGLMRWREDELSATEVGERVATLRDGMARRGIDAFIAYTTLVRPAAVHYLTGFTPYWSDGVLMIGRDGRPVFVTALSKRVGQWLGGVNPTCDILHAPRPGRRIAELVAEMGIARLGALELDMMPGALVDDISASGAVLVDAGDLFAELRARPTPGETRLARHAEGIARAAFEGLSADAATVGEVAGPLERAVRLAGAEECYIAVAPDLGADSRLARHHGSVALGECYAARVSVAYNGVWTRFTRTMRRGVGYASAAVAPLDELAAGLDISRPLANQIATGAAAAGLTIDTWSLEAPQGTRPLRQVAGSGGQDGPRAVPYGVITLGGRIGAEPFLYSTFVAPPDQAEARQAA